MTFRTIELLRAIAVWLVFLIAAPGAFAQGGGGAEAAQARGAAVLFLDAMEKHNEMGLPLLKKAAQEAQNPDVRDMAARMVLNQENEKPALAQLRAAALVDAQAADMNLPVMRAPDEGALAAIEGAAFDRKFLELAILYQEGGVRLLEWAQENLRNDGIRSWAQSVFDRKKVEIAEMKALQERIGA